MRALRPQIMYHEYYEHQFICLGDMLEAVPDLEVGSCAMSGSSLNNLDPEMVFVSPETGVFVRADMAMQETAVIASTK